jgi:hypothetical protein
MAQSSPMGSNAQSWTNHEHTATPVELQAKKLLQAAGAPEIAKEALDAAAEEHPAREGKEDLLAQQVGFLTYRSLVEASSRGAKIADRQWYTTAIRQDEWVLWNDRDLEIAGVFESKVAALSAAS